MSDNRDVVEALDATPNDKLRTLVEEWREYADPPAWDGYSEGVREGTIACADELEALIDDE